MKKLTPLIIGGVFAVTIAVVIITAIMLRHKDVPEGKFKNMVDAAYVGSMECKKCHERKYLEWTTTLHSRIMQDVKANPQVIIGYFKSPSKVRTFKKDDVDYTIGSQWKQQYLKKKGMITKCFPLPIMSQLTGGLSIHRKGRGLRSARAVTQPGLTC
ncbi:MAG: hypothetical protein KKH04_12835 [Proteobacteria bacterium]|nr:hypothetical protein [Pseudomonadota bacterium]